MFSQRTKTDQSEDTHEMSMEEILASIRKYVTDEDSPTTSADFPTPSSLEPSSSNGLDHSQKTHVPPLSINSGDVSKIHILEDHEIPSLSSRQSTFHAKSAESDMISAQSLPSDTLGEVPLTSEQTAFTSAAALSKLLEMKDYPQTAGEVNSNKTLEQLMVELARPMVKNWLEKNLPEIVEKMVSQEIQRITKYIRDPSK